MPSADHSRQVLLRQADWLASVSSPRVRTNSFPSCTFGLYTAISVWPLGFNLSCSLTRQHMPETVSVRKVNGLPRASFSRNLAVQALPLAMCLAPPPALRDFHPVEFAHAERTNRRAAKRPPLKGESRSVCLKKNSFCRTRRFPSSEYISCCRRDPCDWLQK